MTTSTSVGSISKMGKHLKETFGDEYPSAAIKCCRYQFMNLQIWASKYSLQSAVTPCLFFLLLPISQISSKPVISHGLHIIFPL